MKTQTAVEWLVNELKKSLPSVYNNEFEEEINQAKEMEREQHGETWDKAMKNYEDRGGNFSRAWGDFCDYYNETFKNK
jgi:hypothetical protein